METPSRLSDNYPNAYSDFYPSLAPCVFKSGPDWQVRSGPQAQGIVREARPVNGHGIGDTWLSIGTRIYEYLDSTSVNWTSINPLAYANAGEAKPFCPLIVSIGVKPYSLLYEAAVAAATGVKKILAEVGFPGIEVAFVESVVTRSVAAGPKLLSFNPLLDDVPSLRKPFTPALGLSIAPLKYPHFEGTAALYFRLSKDDKRTAILTCAHVARPPPVYGDTGMTRTNPSQPREEFVALGNGGYNNAVKAMMTTIGDKLRSIEVWKNALGRLGEFVQGESNQVTKRRKENEALVAMAMRDIEAVNVLHDEVTKCRTTPDQRAIGFVLHSEKIEVAVKPHGFTNDWALVELYEEKIDWSTFMGNKVYVGGNLSIPDFANTMFPQPSDRVNYQYPQDGLLQAYGIVQDDEIHNPQHLDVHGEKCLLVVKNGSTTGTTVGRINSLDSFTRTYTDYGIKQTSIELAVLPYDNAHGKFSDIGDSGSIVLARDGRIVGILTGGADSTVETDITYVTPYWWVEKQIKAKYPDCFLYDIVQ
ncbi:hypothetical protein JAAARDRAFT_193575 [Jaapia argillacea MUCL 33604]|uniref:Peptidase S1 domain-containing protein n=1 Tax=Jaapia argillacea MUCL 33604 TaxID=933084 RepID=A0A067Q679_9AGAM|nr:hypothetical protein JAAARDRAFT_193575 [Jaapia argillacea MUCL 33604]